MNATDSPLSSAPTGALSRARLPRWSLPGDWPTVAGQPALADIAWHAGRVSSLRPSAGAVAGKCGSAPLLDPHGGADHASASPGPRSPACDLGGAPLLPGLVDAHTHIDKTFTLGRVGNVRPGLLGAIEAMMEDRIGWTAADIRARASRALGWAFDAGVVRLRTHVDWHEPQQSPLAWSVLRELAEEWSDRLALDRVSLIPLSLFADRPQAMALAQTVAAGGPGALLGGFIHSTNWNPPALRHLFDAAQAFDLDVDLHIDEELDPAATGLAETARLLREIDFGGRVVCGHCCALATQDDALALATLDAVARAPITMVSLPITNLLLQDARVGRTPRQRGVTLVKEARERGIPLLIASDNVQDPFCAVGSYDPVEALAAGVLAAQLGEAFDVWSESLCRADWLTRSAPGDRYAWIGARADFVAFGSADVPGWPSRAHARVVWRDGRVVAGRLADADDRAKRQGETAERNDMKARP